MAAPPEQRVASRPCQPDIKMEFLLEQRMAKIIRVFFFFKSHSSLLQCSKQTLGTVNTRKITILLVIMIIGDKIQVTDCEMEGFFSLHLHLLKNKADLNSLDCLQAKLTQCSSDVRKHFQSASLGHDGVSRQTKGSVAGKLPNNTHKTQQLRRKQCESIKSLRGN